MMRQGEYVRPALMCNGSDLNGNPCPLSQVPPGMFEVLIRPLTVPLFAINGQQLHVPRIPPRMQELRPPPGRMVFMAPIPGLSPSIPALIEAGGTRRPTIFMPTMVSQRASEAAAQPGHQANNPFASFKLRYNGFSEVKPFVKAVLEFKKAYAITDEAALKSFPTLLKGMVKSWWKHNITPDIDWHTSMKMLRHTYKARLNPLIALRRLFCQPQLDEPTAEFVQRVRASMNNVPMPELVLSDRSQLDMVYSMLHERIRKKVSRADCTSFEELLRRAKQVEDEIAANPPAPEAQPGAASPPEGHAADEAESSEACKSCISYGDLLIRMCRKLHRGEKTAEELEILEKINQMDKEQLSKMICFTCGSPNIVGLKCQECTDEIPGSCPLVNVRILGKEFNAVVDTGANYSIASADLMQHLMAHKLKFPLKVLVTPVGGMPLQQVVQVATVEVLMAEVKVEAEFVVLPNAVKNVFGIDFVKKAGLVLDFTGAGTWTVRGAPVDQPVLYERMARLRLNEGNN